MAATQEAATSDLGAVVAARVPVAAWAGHQILTGGGNAIDAAVAAALCAAVVEPASCGIGGYGAHMTIGLADGQVVSIDANTAAPQAAGPDLFAADDAGRVEGDVNYYGWLAAGVPGTLAGLELALRRFGRMTLAQALAPAIGYARDGFVVDGQLAEFLGAAAPHLRADRVSAQLYFKDGRLLKVHDRCCNPELANMLETLARRGSADAFYRGDIAGVIVDQMRQHGSAVTREDFASYQARLVQPVSINWQSYRLCTAPPTAGGISLLQALAILQTLDRRKLAHRHQFQHAALEALRLAWYDRWRYLGDPHHLDVPVTRLLSADYARELAGQVMQAVQDRRPILHGVDGYDQIGTVHISAADAQGNLVALTLTHGGWFGACVTVAGLGLTLGHGLSRFDPRPGHPNSIGPGKRPLNNMSPTVLLHGDRPVLAVGGRGGRRIPNAIYGMLVGLLADGRCVREAVNLPRMHTEGTMQLVLDAAWNQDAVDFFAQMGYAVTRDEVAHLSAAGFDPATGRVQVAHR